MEKVHFNTIIFMRECYNNDRDQLYRAVAQQLRLLMENNYACKVYDDDIDVIVIEYEHDERKKPWGGTDLIWASAQEVEDLVNRRLEEQETCCGCSEPAITGDCDTSCPCKHKD